MDIAVLDRGRKDLGDLTPLVKSIEESGQISAGVVRRSTPADGVTQPYVLVAGERRYRACVLAGVFDYLCEDFGELSPLQQKVIELEENLSRKDLTWSEEVLMKQEIHKLRQQQAVEAGKNYTQADLATELNETPANTSRDLKLAKALEINPDLAKAPTKASAVRQLAYTASVTKRIENVGRSPMLKIQDRLVTADMRDFVRTLPTHSVDLCFTDFPFGIEYNFDKTDLNKYEDSAETLKDLITDVVPEILRVVKPTGWLALMMGSTHYEFLRDTIQTCCVTHFSYTSEMSGKFDLCMQAVEDRDAGKEVEACLFLEAEDPEWIWYRPNSRNPSMWPELHAQNQYEKICVVNMGEAVLINKNLSNVLVHDQVYEDRIHEMQRPHSLCLDIVSRFTVGGERVLDLCFGSGSALAAAAALQRDFLGCDMNPNNLGPARMFVAEHYKETI